MSWSEIPRGHVPFCLTRSFLFVTMRSISEGVYQQQRRLPAAKAFKTLFSSHILLAHILPSVNNAWWFAQFQSVSSMLLNLNFKNSHLDCRDAFLSSYSFPLDHAVSCEDWKDPMIFRLLHPFFVCKILWQLIIQTIRFVHIKFHRNNQLKTNAFAFIRQILVVFFLWQYIFRVRCCFYLQNS